MCVMDDKISKFYLHSVPPALPWQNTLNSALVSVQRQLLGGFNPQYVSPRELIFSNVVLSLEMLKSLQSTLISKFQFHLNPFIVL